MTVQEKPTPDRRRRTKTTVERPRCPACDGVKLHKHRSLTDHGEGSTLWWVRYLGRRRFIEPMRGRNWAGA